MVSHLRWAVSIEYALDFKNLVHRKYTFHFSYVGFCCPVSQSCRTLCEPIGCSPSGFPVLHYLLGLLRHMSIVSMMPSNHIICPLLLPSVFPSIKVFSNELAPRIGWPKYWSFSISPSNEYSGLISFRINWFMLIIYWHNLCPTLCHPLN